jgi:hypothetical protein
MSIRFEFIHMVFFVGVFFGATLVLHMCPTTLNGRCQQLKRDNSGDVVMLRFFDIVLATLASTTAETVSKWLVSQDTYYFTFGALLLAREMIIYNIV